jgi:hypothetical protein
LVLTRDEAIDRLNEIFVVLATTVVRGLPTEVELGLEDGMPRSCVLNADHTATLAKSYLANRSRRSVPTSSPRSVGDWPGQPGAEKSQIPRTTSRPLCAGQVPVLGRDEGADV